MKKLFRSSTLFLTMVVLGFIGSVVSAIFYAIPSLEDFDLTSTAFFTFEGACLVCLYLSFKNHSKNVMKGMMGALLAAMLLDCTCWLNTYFGLDTIFSCITIALNTVLFINHFIINNEHHSKSGNILVNQIVVCLLCIVYVVWDALWALSYPLGAATVGAISSSIHCIGVTATVVCVESRLDAYRIDREKAGWTEETGYPEGYVRK